LTKQEDDFLILIAQKSEGITLIRGLTYQIGHDLFIVRKDKDLTKVCTKNHNPEYK